MGITRLWRRSAACLSNRTKRVLQAGRSLGRCKKSKTWIKKKYFRKIGTRSWTFSVENKKSLEDFTSNNEKPKIKSFGLDRISNVEIHHTRQLRNDEILDESFKNSFGVSSTLNEVPQEIILSFTPHQGKYIKSLPLHHSQEIITDTEKELRIKVTLYPTFDFTQKILSHGHNVTVISPESFQNELKLEIQKMLNNYSEKA